MKRLIRSTHPAQYKSGEWAQIVGESEVNGRVCYEVLFQDGSVDTWVRDDEVAAYEIIEQVWSA